MNIGLRSVLALIVVLTMAPAALGSERSVAVAAGELHSCALTSTGKVLCWGDNSSGQLGDGTTTQRLTAVPVLGLPAGILAIAANGGDAPTQAHTCAITPGGGVMCWGNNADGQLGNNSTAEFAVTRTGRWAHGRRHCRRGRGLAPARSSAAG